MYKVRLWSVKQARLMESCYSALEKTLVMMAPVLERIGMDRLEKPVAFIEKNIKGVLFDCQMCGQCALGKTGMSCPMNCPKTIRNGPCGGVREDGFCEVKPDMRCVWVEGWSGAQKMRDSGEFHVVQFAVDYRLKGSSSWLREVRRIRTEKQTNVQSEEAPS